MTPYEKQRNTSLCTFEWRTSCGGYDHGWSYLGRSHGEDFGGVVRALALLAVIAIGAPSPAAAQATDPRGIGVVIIDLLVCDQLVSIEESNCYWMPKEGEAWIEVIGTNELGVGVNRTGKVEDVHGHCYAVQDASLYRSAKDVSAVTVRLEAYGWELDTSPNRFAARPNSLLSVHHGEDPWGVSEGMERYLDTDVTPDCN